MRVPPRCTGAGAEFRVTPTRASLRHPGVPRDAADRRLRYRSLVVGKDTKRKPQFMIEFFEVAMVKSLPNDLIPSPHTPKETHTHAHGRTRSDPTVTMTVHSPWMCRAQTCLSCCVGMSVHVPQDTDERTFWLRHSPRRTNPSLAAVGRRGASRRGPRATPQQRPSQCTCYPPAQHCLLCLRCARTIVVSSHV